MYKEARIFVRCIGFMIKRQRERERENQHVFVRIWFKCSNKPANERSRSRLLLHYVSISTWCGMFFFSLFACYLLLRSPSFQFAWVLLVILLCCCCCCFFHCFSFVFDINAQLLYTEVFACIFCILDHKHMQLQMTHEDANSIKKKLKWIKKKKEMHTNS